MTLICSAVIPDDHEREVIRETICKKFADSYGDHAEKKELHCSYKGFNQGVIDALIQTFEKYPEHTIIQNR